MPTTTAPRKIHAKYRGTCERCGEAVRAGEEVYYDAARRVVWHVGCDGTRPGPIHLHRGEGYGGTAYTIGETLRVRLAVGATEVPQEYADCPHWLHEDRLYVAVTVCTASRTYVREDGLSFGVGEEQGYVYHATARPATEDEARVVREAQEEATARRRAHERLYAIHREVFERGTGEETDYVATLPDGWTNVGPTDWRHGTGSALRVDGGSVLALTSTGYDMYMSGRARLDDVALADEVSALLAGGESVR